MINIRLIEISKEEHLDLVLERSVLKSDDDKARFKNDFKRGYFQGFLVVDGKDNPLAYVLYYYSYSTWESRVIYLFELWLEESQQDDTVFAFLSEQLKSKCKREGCNRINFNVVHCPEKERLIQLLGQNGALNLTKVEEWELFEMNHEAMLYFIESEKKLGEDITLRRVIDIEKDAPQILGLIRELAIFEKMEDQFRMTSGDLIRDYQLENRFYECLVAENAKNDVVGMALYFYTYEVRRGVGCYLEDLYVKPEWRGTGLGTSLWQLMVKSCLQERLVQFVQWNCLAWNEDAIRFYYKKNARNLTQRDALHLFRYRKETIHT